MSYRTDLNDALALLRKARETTDRNQAIRYVAQAELILIEILEKENAR